MTWNLHTWCRGDVDLGDYWRGPDGTVYATVGLIDDPVIVIRPVGRDALPYTEHHVISSRNFAEFERLRPQKVDA